MCRILIHSVRDFAIHGSYGLLDYAAANWPKHLNTALRQAVDLDKELVRDIRQSCKAVTQAYELMPAWDGSALKDREIEAVRADDDMIPVIWLESYEKVLEHRVCGIRKVIESLDLGGMDKMVRNNFLLTNGLNFPKCRNIHCVMFDRSFESFFARDKHISEHGRPYKCGDDGCPHRLIGFVTAPDLQTHVQTAHSEAKGVQELFPKVIKEDGDIFEACKSGNIEAVKRFLDAGVPINAGLEEWIRIKMLPSRRQRRTKYPGTFSPIVVAARYGNTEVCRYLVKRGASPFISNRKGNPIITALGESIRSHNRKLFHSLVEETPTSKRGEFIDHDSFRAHAALAMSIGAQDILDFLWSWNEQRFKPVGLSELLESALKFRSDVTEAHGLFRRVFEKMAPSEQKAFLEFKNRQQWTHLHQACQHQSVPGVHFLVGCMSADQIGSLTSQGQTALAICASSRSVGCVDALLNFDNGAMNNVADNSGSLPVHQACLWRQPGDVLARILAYDKSAVNSQNKDGNTPLHLLLVKIAERRWQSWWMPKLQLMLDTGEFDFTKRNSENKTVFDIASGLSGYLVSREDKAKIFSLLHSYDQTSPTADC